MVDTNDKFFIGVTIALFHVTTLLIIVAFSNNHDNVIDVKELIPCQCQRAHQPQEDAYSTFN